MGLVLLVIRSLLEQEEEQVCVFMTQFTIRCVFFTKIWKYSKKVVEVVELFFQRIHPSFLLDFCMAREREGPFALLSHFTSSGSFLPCNVEGNCAA